MVAPGNGSPQRWAAVGPGGGDNAYRTQTLRYGGVELALDESVATATIVQLWLRAAFVSFVVWAVLALLWLITLFASDSAEASAGMLILGTVIASIIFWVVLLAPVHDEPIGEWKTLLDDKADAATSAYATIYGALARRHTPVQAQALRIRSDLIAPEVVNSRLIIVDGNYLAYVSVFPYGTGLYVGWTMWRRRRSAVLIGMWVKDLIGDIIGRGGTVNQMLRTERVRAMREAVHAAVREGVDVAVQGVDVPIVATFGRDVPIQNLTPTAAPSPLVQGSRFAPTPSPVQPGPPVQPAPAPGAHPSGPDG